MQTYQQTLTGGQEWITHVAALYSRLLSTTAPVDARFYRNGQKFAEALQVEAGMWTSPREGFDEVRITTASGQTVKFGVSDGQSGYDRTFGTVSVSNVNGAFVHSQASVTNADNTISAGNANRRYLLVQNNSATGVLRIALDGGAATGAKGLRLQPGQHYEVPGYCLTNAVHAFMETADATANNVEVVTG